MAKGIDGLKSVGKLTERDIDFLVLEELQVSPEFRDWFSARVFQRPVFKSHIRALHSMSSGGLGESDLVFIFEAEDGSTKGILIENKISAPAQPDQGKRYQDRGAQGITDGKWQEYQTCLIAPRRYLESPTQTEEYDVQIAYEEIMAYFAARRTRDVRYDYRATLLLEGVNRQGRAYLPETNEVMTQFAKDYWDLVQSTHPDLSMQEPKPRAAGNAWINFYPAGIPKSVDVIHLLKPGMIKIILKKKAPEFEAIKARYQSLETIFPELTIELTTKSVALCLPVEPVAKPLETSFESVKSKMRSAVDTLYRLVQAIRPLGFPE